MSTTIYVKAVDGRTVYVPGSQTVVPSKSIGVEDSSFWQRRINDGDVELVIKSKSTAVNAENNAEKDAL